MRIFTLVAFLLISLSNGDEIVLAGTVVSDGQKMIGSRYMGYVKEVFVKLGDRVKREDDLYEIESAEFDIMKTQADLMLEQAKISVEFWRKRLEYLNQRKERLKSKQDIPMADFDDMEAQAENVSAMLDTAQIAVKQAAEKVKQMATIYNYLIMKAPSDGVVVQKNIKVGDMVMPGMLTVMLVDTEDLEVEVSIAEGILASVREGDKVGVEIESLNYRTVGTVKAIIPDANPMTHKIIMRVSFDKAKANIFPGMYAKVKIQEK